MGEGENLHQTMLRAEPDTGLDPKMLRSGPELKQRVGCLTGCITLSNYLLSAYHVPGAWPTVAGEVDEFLSS